jgi:hypothetical protein
MAAGVVHPPFSVGAEIVGVPRLDKRAAVGLPSVSAWHFDPRATRPYRAHRRPDEGTGQA